MKKIISKNLPLVYIIVLNYINYQDTIKCVESLKKLNYSNFQIINISIKDKLISNLDYAQRVNNEYLHSHL